jgi:hypothetical protein
MNPSSDLVNKLWRLCALLRKDGVTYQQYVLIPGEAAHQNEMMSPVVTE